MVGIAKLDSCPPLLETLPYLWNGEADEKEIIMTPQEIQIAVAEEMGWFVFQDVGDWVLRHEKKCVARTCGSEQECWDYYLYIFAPPYTTSIDSIREACLERFTTPSERYLFAHSLSAVLDKWEWQLTALDWCEAFLETCKEIKK